MREIESPRKQINEFLPYLCRFITQVTICHIFSAPTTFRKTPHLDFLVASLCGLYFLFQRSDHIAKRMEIDLMAFDRSIFNTTIHLLLPINSEAPRSLFLQDFFQRAGQWLRTDRFELGSEWVE